MGGVVKAVFGGSSSKSKSQQQSTDTSYNLGYDAINEALNPLMQAAPEAGSAIAALLGLKGDTGQRSAFDAYRGATGYDFAKNEGMNSVKGAMSGAGTYESGATGKALAKFTTGLADQTFDSYLKNLMGLGNAGLGAAGQIGAAGDYRYGQSTGSSSGSSSSYSGGLGKALGFGS